MKIIKHNLPADVYDVLKEELKILENAASKKHIALPEFSLSIIALTYPAEGVPVTQIQTPGTRPSGSYRKLADYEILNQSFELIREGENLWIIGAGDEAVYHGFYTALESLTGVLWSGIGTDEIRFGRKKDLPCGPQKPAFPFRVSDGGAPGDQITGKFSLDKNTGEFIKWLHRNRINAYQIRSSRWELEIDPRLKKSILKIAQARRMKLIFGDHSMELFLPEKTFSKHPEWFGMRGGKRVKKDLVVIPECPDLHENLPVQPCYSNTSLVEYLTDRMAEHINAIPELYAFSVWPHDGVNNWCQCPECLKKTPYEHMHYLATVLAEKTDPSIPIEIIAYSNLLNLPKEKLPFNERLFTLFCPFLRPFTHRVYEEGGAESTLGKAYPEPDRIHPVDDRDYGPLFEKWRKCCMESGQGIGVFEYGNYLFDETRRYDHKRYQYSPNPHLRSDELAWYLDRDVSIFYFCAVYNSWPDSFHQILMHRLFWYGADCLEEFTQSYYSSFGACGKKLQKLLQAVRDSLLENTDTEKALDNLEDFCARNPDLPEKINLWIEYLRMCRKSRSLELSGDYDAAAKNEKAIQAYIGDLKGKLERHTNLSYLALISRTAETHFRKKQIP